MTEPTPHEEAAMRLATDAHAVRCALRLGRLVGRSDKQKISDVIVRLERTVSTLLAANQAQAEELKALREAAARIVSANADTHERGLRDQIDNAGRNYQSQFLADALSDLIALLHQGDA